MHEMILSTLAAGALFTLFYCLRIQSGKSIRRILPKQGKEEREVKSVPCSEVTNNSLSRLFQLQFGPTVSPSIPANRVSMESSSWRPVDSDAAVDPSGNWRLQLMPEARQRIVNKIADTLKRHLPVSVPEGLAELQKIAVRFEEKIYSAATNQSDYLRKISLKMLSMETKKTQRTSAIDPSYSNPTVGNQSPAVPLRADHLPKIPLRILSMETETQGRAAIDLSHSNPTVGNQSPATSAAVPGIGRKHNIEKEPKGQRKRRAKKPKVPLPSPSEPSIPSLLQQLLQAIAGEQGHSRVHQPLAPLPQQLSASPLQQQRDMVLKAELQSKLEPSQNVIEDLGRCIPLLQKQLEIEKSYNAEIRSAIDEIEIREASFRAQQNVSYAILQRELSRLSKSASTVSVMKGGGNQ